MANALETEKMTLRGWGPLSPLYDEALTWAASLHRDQRRKNTNVAYIAHLVAVSSLVLEDGGTETEAIAGLLHDAIEDCGAQVEPILRQRFGEAVVDIVVECSDTAPVGVAEIQYCPKCKLPWPVRKDAYIEHLRKATESALRVSAADKLHNARATLGDLRETHGLWLPHNACHHQSLWYYHAISVVITERLPSSRTGAELAEAVDKLYLQTKGVTKPQPEELPRHVPPCPTDPKCTTAAEVPVPPHVCDRELAYEA